MTCVHIVSVTMPQAPFVLPKLSVIMQGGTNREPQVALYVYLTQVSWETLRTQLPGPLPRNARLTVLHSNTV